MYLYTHYLQEKVVNSISELYNFMAKANTTLELKVGLQQQEGMGFLHCVFSSDLSQHGSMALCTPHSLPPHPP